MHITQAQTLTMSDTVNIKVIKKRKKTNKNIKKSKHGLNRSLQC